MKIGVALPAQVAGVTRKDVLGFAERAERRGLDSVWVLDRLGFGGPGARAPPPPGGGGGRRILGMAVGARESDFQAVGVSMKQRRRRLEETVALVRQAAAGQAVDHQGQVFQVRVGTGALPATPAPPFGFGGFGADAVRRAVRLGDGFILGGRGPEYARETVPQVRKGGARGRRARARAPTAPPPP